jgi:hypothetical protein
MKRLMVPPLAASSRASRAPGRRSPPNRGSQSRATINGTYDSAGVVCSTPAAVNQITAALRDELGQTISVGCEGITWRVGACAANNIERTTDSAGACECSSTGHTFSPCKGEPNWGGVGTATCGAPSQQMRVIVQ